GDLCPLIAYPYGIAPASVRRVAARYFSAGFSTRLDRAQSSEDPMWISRIDSYELRSQRAVRTLIEGGTARFRVRRTMRDGRRLLFNP
ncbi:MAG: polysaccharide deacetylase family protein, partial [Isosphaeraceae bacterium]